MSFMHVESCSRPLGEHTLVQSSSSKVTVRHGQLTVDGIVEEAALFWSFCLWQLFPSAMQLCISLGKIPSCPKIYVEQNFHKAVLPVFHEEAPLFPEKVKGERSQWSSHPKGCAICPLYLTHHPQRERWAAATPCPGVTGGRGEVHCFFLQEKQEASVNSFCWLNKSSSVIFITSSLLITWVVLF